MLRQPWEGCIYLKVFDRQPFALKVMPNSSPTVFFFFYVVTAPLPCGAESPNLAQTQQQYLLEKTMPHTLAGLDISLQHPFFPALVMPTSSSQCSGRQLFLSVYKRVNYGPVIKKLSQAPPPPPPHSLSFALALSPHLWFVCRLGQLPITLPRLLLAQSRRRRSPGSVLSVL